MKYLVQLLTRAKELVKQDLKKAQQLDSLSKQKLNMEILQELINNAPDGVEMIVQMDGANLVIRHTNNQIGYKSFKENYNSYRGN